MFVSRTVYGRWPLFILAVFLLCAFTLQSNSQAGLRPVAEILLDAPINATWAANHPEYWQGRGVSGLILHSRFDAIPDNEDVALPLQEKQSFLDELRTALRRLAEAGVTKNFLYVAITPEAKYITEREHQVTTLEHIRQAASMAKELKMQGVCVDTRSSSLFYDFRWDGYPQPNDDHEILRIAARDFGKRIIANVIQEYPETEIILMADSPEASGALSFSLMEGCIAGVGAAESVHVHLSFPLGPPEVMPALQERTQNIRGYFDLHAPQVNAEKRVGMCWRINPISASGGQCALDYRMETLRPYLCAAKVLSEEYVLLQAPEGGWWHIAEEEAAQYQHLLQGGMGAVKATPTVHPLLSDIYWKTPIDAMRIVNELHEFPEGSATVLQEGEDASLAFWRGAADRITIEQRERLVKLTQLDTFTNEDIKPRFGHILIARTNSPILLQGLSIRDWAASAAIQLKLGEPLQENHYQATALVHISNPFATTLDGQLEYLSPAYASFGGGSFPIVLAPGEAKEYERLLQGRWTVHDTPDLGVSVLFPSGETLNHSQTFNVMPELRWQHTLDGACIGAPLLQHWLDEDHVSIIACSERGDVVCLGLDGQTQWLRQTPNRLVNGPVSAAGPSAFAFTMDHRGEVWGFDEEGTRAYRDRLPVEALAGSLHYTASLDAAAGDLLAAALGDGRMSAKPLQGEGWEYHFAGQSCFIAPGLNTANAPYDAFSEKISRQLFVADGKDDGFLTCFDFLDGLFWQRELQSAPTCAPLVVRGKGEERHRIVTASGEGVIELWQAETAEKLDTTKTISRLPILQLAYGDIHPAGGMEYLALDNAGIQCFSGSMRKLWRIDLPGAQQIVLLPDCTGIRWIAADTQGALTAGDAEGKTLWRDGRALAPLSGPPLIVPLAGGKEWLCVTASRDGAVRAILIPQ